MINGQIRVLRRLRALFRSHNYQPVGVRIAGGEAILFRAYNNAGDQYEAAYLRLPWLNLCTTRNIAQGLLGGAAAAVAHELYNADTNEAVYIVSLDTPPDPHARVPAVNRPRVVRWFKQQALAAGIGQQDNGFLTFGRSQLLPGD